MMQSKQKLWELGSGFDWPLSAYSLPTSVLGFPGQFLGTGRVSLSQLLNLGFKTFHWKRLWVPSYYCYDVIESLNANNFNVEFYDCGPTWDEAELIPWQPGDVLLRVNYFAFGIPILSCIPEWVVVIEDHTHNPYGVFSSNASYVIASLRKFFPVPDGALLWSPKGLPLPKLPESSITHDKGVLHRIAAMSLKRLYLTGQITDKLLYRYHESESEKVFSIGKAAPMSAASKFILSEVSIENIIDSRRKNWMYLKSALAGFDIIECFEFSFHSPIFFILLTKDRNIRDFLHNFLISKNIFPAILWPINNELLSFNNSRAIDFSSRMLALHIDCRYTTEDMEVVAGQIKLAVSELYKTYGNSAS